MITENSHIIFHLLRYTSKPNKNNQYIVNSVRKDDISSIHVDDRAIQVYQLLSKGKSVKETAKEMHFSVDIVLVIIKIFLQANFVKSIDGELFDKEKLYPSSLIQFFPLRSSTSPDEHGLYALVRWDTDDSLRIDKNILELTNLITKGATVKEAAQKIGFSVDVIISLLKMFKDAHFIKSIDGIALEDTGKKIKPWFTNIDGAKFAWLFSKPFLGFLFIFITIGIFLGIQTAGIPTYKNIFWTPDLFVVCLSIFLLNFLILFPHEIGHFIVTKIVGGEAVMRISYRYLYAVAETESYHLAMVPKKKRYYIYSAGIIVDLFIIAVTYWIIALSHIFQFHLGPLYEFLFVIILYEVIGISWQFNVFLETDMYNFLTEFLNIENLKNDALKYIDLHTKRWKKILFYPIKRLLMLFSSNYTVDSDDLRSFSKNALRKLYIYMIVLILGLIFTTIQYFYITIPRDITYIYESILAILQALKIMDIISFLKSIAIILYVLFEYLLLIFLKFKDEREKALH